MNKRAKNRSMNETDALYKNWNIKEQKLYTNINYQNNKTNYCSKAMRRRKYFRTSSKNNLDTVSYMRCLMLQNCKGLKFM